MRLPLTLLVAIVTVGSVACGSDDARSADDAGVEGDLVAVEITEDGGPRALVDGTELTLRLEDGELVAGAGCNSMRGPYEVVDGELRVEGLVTTEMGCDPARHEQDEWFAGLLWSTPSVEPDARAFVLRSGATTIRFVDRSDVHPDRDLVGTTWSITGFSDGTDLDSAVSDAGGSEAQVVFDEDGTVSGFDGCNRFGDTEAPAPDGSDETVALRYRVVGDELDFEGAFVSTLRRCDDVDSERFRSALTGTVTWEIDEDRLILRTDDGRGVTFRATDG